MAALLAANDVGIEDAKNKLRAYVKSYPNRFELSWHIYRIKDEHDIHTVYAML